MTVHNSPPAPAQIDMAESGVSEPGHTLASDLAEVVLCSPEVMTCRRKPDATVIQTLRLPDVFTHGLGPAELSQFGPGHGVASKKSSNGIHWGHVVIQSIAFTQMMNVARIATEARTRNELKGPFWKDYFRSVKSLRGWSDGDGIFTNYIAHPLEGAVAGNILIQNSPSDAMLRFGRSRQYWLSRARALGWAAVVSTQFELGPFGEAAIGNVGLKPSDRSKHPMAYVDLVVTPLVGTGWLIAEDILDRFVVRRIEGATTNRVVRLLFRSWLNPSRSLANMLRREWWWHRDDRPLKEGGRRPAS